MLVFFGVEVDQTQLDAATKKTDKLLGMFQGGIRVVQAFGAALAGHALTRFITDTVAAADDVGDLAARLGVTTDEFQIMKAVADDVGTSVGAMQTAFKTLAHQMRDTGKGAGKEFNELGIATRNADGSMRSVTDVFWETGTAIGELTEQAQRQDLAQKLLGRSALDLLPIFAGGAEEVAKYRAQIAETAVVFDEAFIDQSDAAAKKIQAFQNRLARIRALIVEHLLPAFEWTLDQLIKGSKAVQDFIKSGKALQGVLAAGSALLLQWASRFALNGKNLGSVVGWLFRLRDGIKLVGRMIKGFALFALVDELITLFRGGDTLIGRMIDGLFGVGSAAKGVELVTAAAKDLWNTFMLVLDALFDIRGDGDMTADQLEAAFMRATENIAKMFEGLLDLIVQKVLGRIMGISEDAVRQARVAGGINPETGARESGQAVEEPSWFIKKFAELTGFEDEVNARRAAAGISIPSIAPPPSLTGMAGAPRIGTTTVDSRNQTVNVSVGNATPETARQIGREVGRVFNPAAQDFGAAAASVGLGR